jgi:hypothetical protein
MYNLVRAAEAGWKGSVGEARDFELVWNGCAVTVPACANLPPGVQDAKHFPNEVSKDEGTREGEAAGPGRGPD